MLRPIVAVGNLALHTKARKVSQIDRSVQRLIDDMIETMRAAPGVGLAAPQVGVPLRLAVIEVEDKVYVIVNPEIVKTSDEYEPDEGCLSVPGYWGRLKRYEKVSVRARDRAGKECRINAEGLLAQALQHEIDHLDGYLYVDRMREQMGDAWVEEFKKSPPPRKREVDQQEQQKRVRRPAGEVPE